MCFYLFLPEELRHLRSSTPYLGASTSPLPVTVEDLEAELALEGMGQGMGMGANGGAWELEERGSLGGGWEGEKGEEGRATMGV